MNVVHQVLNPDDSELLDIADLPEYAGIGVDARIRELVGSAFTAKEVARGLSVSASSVHRRRRHRALWGINHARTWRFPAAQFVVADGRPVRQVRGLEVVLKELPADLHPLSIDGFLHTPQPDLLVRDKLVSPWTGCGLDALPGQYLPAQLRWTGTGSRSALNHCGGKQPARKRMLDMRCAHSNLS
ncbi:Uncharacterised protein [Mycolicibacterium fortuitum]|uniref:Uncharacterized protein n=1 Tax=Mycolicibacterium fortuitum TaxID=1766 RepID=A0A378WCH0_MYCFO|nr:Uncharacterised protein [Mycolicibacterium fortuitum]